MKVLRNEILECVKGMREFRSEMELLRASFASEALLTDLEIGQMPEDKAENAFHAVCVLATRLGVPLEERDVVYAERVGARPDEAGGRPRRMVVRLARRSLRDELLRAARLRRTGFFIGVREECRRLQWRYCWTRRGRIFARQGEGRQVFQLRSEMDIPRVFGSDA
ncbi:hypothetical protein ACJJTC_005830 [Scirpophaga incertulas]